MKKFLIYATSVVFLLCLISCSTVKTLYGTISTGYPLWYFNSRISAKKGQVSFSGHGEGETQRQAELIAYSEIIDKLSSFLGKEVSNEINREFLIFGKIESFGIRIVDSYHNIKKEKHMVAFLAVAERETLEPYRSESAKRLEQTEDEIIKLVEQGDEYIQNGMDMKGISCYLKSMVLSHSMTSLPYEYSFEDLRNEIKKILSTAKIEIKKTNEQDASCSIFARRRDSAIYENIQECPVKASFYSTNGQGQTYMDSLTYITDKKGRIDYKMKDKAIVDGGSIEFSFDLDSELKDLEKVSPKVAAEIRAELQKGSAIFSYSRTAETGPIGFSVIEYDGNGEFTDGEKYTFYLRNLFSQEQTAFTPIVVYKDVEDKKLVLDFYKKFPFAGGYLVVKMSPIDTQQAGSIMCVTSEGRAIIYLATEERIFDSGVMYSSGFGNNYEDALDNCLEKFCQVVFSLIRASYV